MAPIAGLPMFSGYSPYSYADGAAFLLHYLPCLSLHLNLSLCLPWHSYGTLESFYTTSNPGPFNLQKKGQNIWSGCIVVWRHKKSLHRGRLWCWGWNKTCSTTRHFSHKVKVHHDFFHRFLFIPPYSVLKRAYEGTAEKSRTGLFGAMGWRDPGEAPFQAHNVGALKAP